MKDSIFVTENNYGSIHVSDTVILNIVEQEIVRVVGIELPKTDNLFAKILDSIRGKMKVYVNEAKVLVLDVPIKVVYGTNIHSVARNVQEKIVDSLSKFLNIEDAIVNIYVVGVLIPNED